MENKKMNFKNILISGFAMFAIFFGAGNLILPPHLGLIAGQKWYWAWIGFALSGPGLTFIGMIAMAKNLGNPEEYAGKVGRNFSIILGSIIILCIGPLMSVPRTSATTLEVLVDPFIPNFSPVLFAILFFSISLFFALKRSKMIDFIGTGMTPFLLIILFIIIYKGLSTFTGISPIIGENQLSTGFIEGYHTMDSLAPMVLAGMIINDYRAKGIVTKKELTRYTIYTELIAATGLTLVYGGLSYLGSQAYSFADPTMTRTELLNSIIYNLLGSSGNLIMGLVVALACLTTSIGLISATGNYFNTISNDKLKYNHIVIISAIVSAILSIKGVEEIMAFSIPVLVSIYPVVIVLSFLNLFDKGNISHRIYKSATLFTFLVSLVKGIETAGFKNNFLVTSFANLPLWEIGFGWLIGCLTGILVGLISYKLSKRRV